MFAEHDIDTIRAATAYCKDGNKIGGVGDVYLDDATGQPTWATINTGLFGTKTSFVPLEGARLDGDRLTVNYGKDVVTGAPSIDEDGHLTPEQEADLYRYYNLAYGSDDRDVVGDGRRADEPIAAGTFTDGDRTVGDRDNKLGDVNVTRGDVDHDAKLGERDVNVAGRDDVEVAAHEERLVVGKEQREAGQVRLRKVQRTEQQTVTVPVTKEEVVVERVPGSGVVDDKHLNDGDVNETVTLREEVPVVEKEVVETERVRLGKETVTENREVSGEVRKEEVRVDGDVRDDQRGVGEKLRDGVAGVKNDLRDGDLDGRNDRDTLADELGDARRDGREPRI